MARGYFIFYSDSKIALELNTENGVMSLPQAEMCEDEIGDEKAIKNIIIARLKVEIEGYEVLRRDKDSLFLLIGDWEDRISPKDSKNRVIWRKIKDCEDILEEKIEKESLTFLRKTYSEVVLDNGVTVGIAKNDECRRFGLTTRAALLILTKDDNILIDSKKNQKMDGIEKKPSLLTQIMIGERAEEAGYRLLTENLKIITELNEKGRFSHKELSEKKHIHVLAGDIGQSLTFFSETQKNHVLRPLRELSEDPLLKKGLKVALGTL